jgi:hypothetical protein
MTSQPKCTKFFDIKNRKEEKILKNTVIQREKNREKIKKNAQKRVFLHKKCKKTSKRLKKSQKQHNLKLYTISLTVWSIYVILERTGMCRITKTCDKTQRKYHKIVIVRTEK